MKNLLGKLTGKKEEPKKTVVRNEDTRAKAKQAYEQSAMQINEQLEKDKETLKQKNPYAVEDEPEPEPVNDESSDEEVKTKKDKEKKKVVVSQEDEDLGEDRTHAFVTTGMLKGDKKETTAPKQISKSETTSTDVVKTVVTKFDNVKVKHAKAKSIEMKSRIDKFDLEDELKDMIRKDKKPSETPDYDSIFEDAGTEKGVQIWQIQKLLPVPIDKHLYGIFNTGDCYLVLFTHDSQDTENRPKSLFYWFGEKAPLLKRAVLCNIATHLTEKLENCKSYAQEENQEMDTFIKLFSRPIQRAKEETSMEESIRSLPQEKKIVKLIKITTDCKAKKCRPVFEELGTENVFICFAPANIFVWVGKKASLAQKMKTSDLVDIIRHEDKRGPFEEVIHVHEGQEKEDFLAVVEKFKLSTEKDKKSISEPDETNFFKVMIGDDKKLKISPVTDKPVTKAVLNSNHTYLVECKNEIYTWFGNNSLGMERKFCEQLAKKISAADKLVITKVFDGYEPVLFRERFDVDFYLLETPMTFEQRRYKYLNHSIQTVKKKNVDIIHETYQEPFVESLINPWEYDKAHLDLDDKMLESKELFDIRPPQYEEVTTSRVDDGRKTSGVDDKLEGHFWQDDCYLIFYVAEWDADEEEEAKKEEEEDEEDEEEEDEESDDDSEKKKLALINRMRGVDKIYDSADEDDTEDDESDEDVDKNKSKIQKNKKIKNQKIHHIERRILFCWQGVESQQKSALHMAKNRFLKKVDEKNPTIVSFQTQYHESRDFLTVFKTSIVIHRGSHRDYDAATYGTRAHLFRIYCLSPLNSRAVEVDCRKVSLNSNDCFVLISRKRTYFWVGAHVPDPKKEIAKKLFERLKALRKQNPFSVLSEGLEPETFWEEMDDESGEYETDKFKFAGGSVHECSLTSKGDYRVMHIGTIGQPILSDDLATSKFTMIFKFDTIVYVWYPQHPEPSERERKNAIAAARSVLWDEIEEDDDDEKQKKVDGTKIMEIYSGKEPIKFIRLFPGWNKPKKFVDKWEEATLARERDFQAKISVVYPYIEQMRLRFPQFLTSDENVNIHNMVTLFLVSEAREQWPPFYQGVIELANEKFPFSEDFALDFFKYCRSLPKGTPRKKKEDSDIDDYSDEDTPKVQPKTSKYSDESE